MIAKFSSILVLLLLAVSSCNLDNTTYAEITTVYGTMKVKLYDSTPIHKENFIQLAKEGYYDSLLFHRVISGFMIQGGDPDSKNAPAGKQLGNGGPNYKLDAEIGAPHFKGALAAARQPDQVNPERQSSGSQFYIVHGRTFPAQQLDRIAASKGITYTEEQKALYTEIGGTPGLDMDYTVFGEVVEGLEVIDKIAAVSVDRLNRPIEDVKMSVKILK